MPMGNGALHSGHFSPSLAVDVWEMEGGRGRGKKGRAVTQEVYEVGTE